MPKTPYLQRRMLKLLQICSNILQKNFTQVKDKVEIKSHIECNIELSNLLRDAQQRRKKKIRFRTNRRLVYKIEMDFLQSKIFNTLCKNIANITQKSSEELIQSKTIYFNFCKKFQKNQPALILKQFQIIMKKYCKVSSLQTTARNRKQQDQFSFQNQYQYSVGYLSLSSFEIQFIFLDETTFGHSYKSIKCLYLKDQSKTWIYSKKNKRIMSWEELGLKDSQPTNQQLGI